MTTDDRQNFRGPNVTPARTARVRDLTLRFERHLEELARACESEVGACVLLGESAHVDALVREAEDVGFVFTTEDRAHGFAVLSREVLASRLDALARSSDADKVRHGPPDEPHVPGATLLVCALEDVVAVCWRYAPAPVTLLDLVRSL